MKKEGIKLNIGCGTKIAEGFVNIDNSPSLKVQKIPGLKFLLYKMNTIKKHQYEREWPNSIVCSDALQYLKKWDEGSISKIYSSHFLEHLPYSKAISLLKECYRTLSQNGSFRLVVPDLVFHAKRYLETVETEQKKAHDQFLFTVAGAYLEGGRPGQNHCYMYDYWTLRDILEEIGFSKVVHCSFKSGLDPELCELDIDEHKEESLWIEAYK